MNIGMKGKNHSGKTEWIYFERLCQNGSHLVRVMTAEGIIYVDEENFLAMLDGLYGTATDYIPRHERKE